MKNRFFLLLVLLTLCVPVWAEEEQPAFPYQLSKFTTHYDTKIQGRTINVEKATWALYGVILQPGETLSFNQVVGPRTYARGYREAKIIVGGKYENGLGGGICQVSTTLFNAALMCNMEITERHCHSLRSSYVEPGRDATVSYGSLDLKITNPHMYPVLLSAYAYDGELSFAFYGSAENIPADVVIWVDKINTKTYLLNRYVPTYGTNYQSYSTYE